MAIEENVWRKDECQDENERRRNIISKGVEDQSQVMQKTLVT